MELVSVIIPVHNGGHSVRRCVNSILNQTYSEIEIIIVNDGSTDNTKKICNDLQKKSGDKLVVIDQENKGVSSARNRGIEEAGGNFLFFVDADDYVESDMIEKFICAIRKKSSDLVIAGYFFDVPVSKEKKVEIIENHYRNVYYPDREALKKDFVDLWDKNMLYNVWNKMFLSQIIKQHNIKFVENKVFNEDRDFVRDYLRCCSTVMVLESCFYHYYRNDNSTTGIYRPELFQIRKEEYFILKKYFEEFGVTDKKAEEYLARQHVDRIMGCVENLFHMDGANYSEIKKRIKFMIKDPLFKETVKKTIPKSGKMKLLIIPYRLESINGIYISTRVIYWVKSRYPELFHKLKQNR